MSDQKEPTKQVAAAVKPVAPVVRFTEMVLKEMTTLSGGVEPTNLQKKLMQSYFIKMSSTLDLLETKRMAKTEQYREEIPYSWANVNLPDLTQKVVAYTAISLDPLQKNHISLIPYLNKHTKKYDVGFLDGYVGKELKAKKYGYDVPDLFVHEIVYSNDTFKMYKKSKDNKIEDYKFEVAENAFDRGEVVGGFYAHIWFDKPEKNIVKEFSKTAIEKRRPAKASAEFWGGDKEVTVWKVNPDNNTKYQAKETITVEGWYDEMCLKTIKRASYDAIAIDSEKIDEAYVRMLQAEAETEKMPADNNLHTPLERIENNISDKANKKAVVFDDAHDVIDENQTSETIEEIQHEEPQDEKVDTLQQVGQELADKENGAADPDDDMPAMNFGGDLFDKDK